MPDFDPTSPEWRAAVAGVVEMVELSRQRRGAPPLSEADELEALYGPAPARQANE
ncbi:hypothetical protein ACIRD3_32145 [Kitasatospora sp. NPDC093550]|uniref:hypothetical protein n=1 Tax=Kitasatospora sp. NPDC093550 TaxID=3364089 RepID=UPI00382266A6